MVDRNTYYCPKCDRYSLYYNDIYQDYICDYCGYASRFKHNSYITRGIREEPLASRIKETSNKYG